VHTFPNRVGVNGDDGLGVGRASAAHHDDGEIAVAACVELMDTKLARRQNPFLDRPSRGRRYFAIGNRCGSGSRGTSVSE
jgi:hypothetical protein